MSWTETVQITSTTTMTIKLHVSLQVWLRIEPAPHVRQRTQKRQITMDHMNHEKSGLLMLVRRWSAPTIGPRIAHLVA